MSGIPEELIERVRDAADMLDVIGQHVELRRTGSDYRGPCPFHGGTHRNLAVIPRKQMFYCFVCHEGGDVFTFLMKKLGMDYPTAVREVARQVGITIPDRPTAGPDPREPLFSAVGVAHDWYQRQLRDSRDAGAARDYLQRRGFTLESLLPYGLGFAPRGPAFLAAMDTLGVGEDTLLAAGLAVRRDDGTVRPRFWNRLVFPIHDRRARVVGFGGRVLGDGEPKYLNSPDTDIFHKGRLLYNLHAAKHAIRKAEHAVVVEGYFDVLRLVEAGVEHVVAPLGTGFTLEQADLLRRLAPRVTLLFDSDSAGLRATFRTADQLLRAKARVMVATLPEGEDPDTLVVRGGADAATKVLRDAIDVFERKLQLLERKGWLADLAGRRRALDRLLPTLRAAADAVTRDLYVTRVSELLGVSRESVLREIAERPERRPRPPAPAQEVGQAAAARAWRPGPERDLVRAMIHQAALRPRIADAVPDRSVLRGPDAALFAALADVPDTEPAAALLDTLTGEPRALLTDLLNEQWAPPDVDTLVTASLDKLEARKIEAEITELDKRFPFASEAEQGELAREKSRLSRERSRLDKGSTSWKAIR